MLRDHLPAGKLARPPGYGIPDCKLLLISPFAMDSTPTVFFFKQVPLHCDTVILFDFGWIQISFPDGKGSKFDRTDGRNTVLPQFCHSRGGSKVFMGISVQSHTGRGRMWTYLSTPCVRCLTAAYCPEWDCHPFPSPLYENKFHWLLNSALRVRMLKLTEWEREQNSPCSIGIHTQSIGWAVVQSCFHGVHAC